MICPEHRKPIEYVCKSMSCDFTMLCQDCRKNHLKSRGDRQRHVQSITSIKSAIAQAEGKLGEQKETLEQLLSPFNNQEQMHRMIENQKRQLNAQRQEIIRKVNSQFDAEIRQLENSNQLLLRNKYHDFPLQEIEQKLQDIIELQRTFKDDHQTLKQTLGFSINMLMDKIKDQHPEVVSSMQMQSNQYWSYGKIKHDFFLSRLSLKKQIFNFKLLKKMQNNSKLYFLIDNYEQDKYLHYFSPTDNCIRIYDIEQEKWKSHTSTFEIPSFGATIHDPKSGRFYIIGGTKKRDKSNQIIWFHKEKGWGQAKMNSARSSAMVSLVDSGSDAHDFILIAGGIGNNKKHLKLCEMFNPINGNSEQMAPMNFGVSSGTLINFNGNRVFRIGGLGQFNRDTASICEISEKFQYDGGQGKWSYVELQVVNPDPTKKFKLFHANQAAIQINPNEIFVFGGWSHGNSGVRDSYIIEVQQIAIKGQRDKKSYRYYVRWANEKPLISGQGFADLRPIIHNRRVVSLQNITHGENQVLEKEKKLIEFDMYKWYEYENIVNI